MKSSHLLVVGASCKGVPGRMTDNAKNRVFLALAFATQLHSTADVLLATNIYVNSQRIA